MSNKEGIFQQILPDKQQVAIGGFLSKNIDIPYDYLSDGLTYTEETSDDNYKIEIDKK